MPNLVHCHFVDEPLSTEESDYLADAIQHSGWFVDHDGFEERRVPGVAPLPGESGGGERELEMTTRFLRKNLLRAGIAEDHGRQVVWAMPCDIRLGVLFQQAIAQETGVYPYMLQRWRFHDDGAVRELPRLIDTEGLTRGK